MTMQSTDVLILGAGLSGIGAACHITRELKGKNYLILERRQAIGGTWDLFRYPGIRSDSDMTTFGYNFRPWRKPQVLADGPSIRQYIADTADEYGVTKNIRFGRKVVRAEWSSATKSWTVTTQDEASGAEEQWSARYLIAGTGYYNYDQGHAPEFPGSADFQGQIVHPQHWPENLDVKGKKITVVGSGATAITLVPSLAKMGATVTMLQRSPTYVLSVPDVDPMWRELAKVLPVKAVFKACRARNIGLQRLMYFTSRSKPEVAKRFVLSRAKNSLQGKVDIKHFSPDYNPWDQRLCVVPRGDLFKVLRSGEAEIVTDKIKTFDASGIQLNSGKHLDADIIVTATGLKLQLLGGADVIIDGKPLEMKDRMMYKGMMLEGVPNALAIIGYTNASWTLKSDLVTQHFCRLIRYTERKGKTVMTPCPTQAHALPDTVMGSLDSGYINRAADLLPRQGDKAPWVLLNDYVRDAVKMRLGRIGGKDLKLA